jgi:hypothetical protein
MSSVFDGTGLAITEEKRSEEYSNDADRCGPVAGLLCPCNGYEDYLDGHVPIGNEVAGADRLCSTFYSFDYTRHRLLASR